MRGGGGAHSCSSYHLIKISPIPIHSSKLYLPGNMYKEEIIRMGPGKECSTHVQGPADWLLDD